MRYGLNSRQFFNLDCFLNRVYHLFLLRAHNMIQGKIKINEAVRVVLENNVKKRR